jgi:ubiquitin-protein ligase
MNIPPSYPSKPPEVIFSTKVFHPLVDISTGRLDITVIENYLSVRKSFLRGK